jgi:pyruvate/2-oxoglutarate dehydrogenase complex dihydrolipoamide acyltransferase (E2) component
VSATDVVLARETANDEVGTVVAIHAASGTQVEQGQLLFEIENSKVTQELEAPASGRIVHGLQLGQTIPFGVAIAQVIDAADAAVAEETAPPPVAGAAGAAPPPPAEAEPAAFRYVSEPAAALIAQHGVAEERLPGGFVTGRDVRALLGIAPPAPQRVPPAPVAAPQAVPVQQAGQPVSGRKAVEIDRLGKGAGGTLLSVLGVTLGEIHVDPPQADFLEGRITDLVIFEASRLMRKYPLLNAFYQDGRVVLHDAVHAGMAIDDGGRLMVYGIEHSDGVDLPELGVRLCDAIERYVGNGLTAAELTRATFTVTDLSASDLDFVLPLLPVGQSCIIGVTHSAGSGFRLFAGFDHRVTEGREVSLFLGELRDRLRSFGARHGASGACSFCGVSLADTVSKARAPGLLQVVGRSGEPALCCVSCWNGW